MVCFNLGIKRTILYIQKIRKHQDFEFLVYLCNRILLFFKQNFSQVSVLKFLNYFGLVIFDWIHSWDPYNKWEQKETDMSSLKILKDVQKDFYLCFWMTLICVMCNFFSSISVPASFPRIILKFHNFVVTPRWLNRL